MSTSSSPVRTFTAVLADLLRRSPGNPLVTFYDHSTGERVEISVVTYANWVAKVSSLLCDEYGLERGQRLRVELPTHWLGPVFVGAAWTVGLVLEPAGDSDTLPDDLPDAVVCGPESLARWAGHADDVVVLACSLLPLGVRFPQGVPAGVHDVGIEVWGQPDSFIPWDPPTADDLALDHDGEPRTQSEVMEAAAAGSLLTDGGRLLTVANPASPPGLATFTEPLVRGGSVVLVARPDADRLTATAEQERATSVLVDLP